MTVKEALDFLAVISRLMCALLGHYFALPPGVLAFTLPARCCRCGKLVE